MILKVKVKTSSGKQEIEEISQNELKVSLKSVPENNKANEELVKLLHKYFKRQVKIKSGFTSKNKIIEVDDEI